MLSAQCSAFMYCVDIQHRSCTVWMFSTAHVLCEFMYCVVIQLDYETQIVTLEAQVLEGVNGAQQLVSSPDVN